MHFQTLVVKPRCWRNNRLKIHKRKEHRQHAKKTRMDIVVAVERSQLVIQLVQQQRSKGDEKRRLGGKGKENVEDVDDGLGAGCGLQTLLAEKEELMDPIGLEQADA